MDKLADIKNKYQSPNENISWLISEIERLRKENGGLSDECIRYTKEIERLRDALRTIALCQENDYTEYYIKIARRALKGE